MNAEHNDNLTQARRIALQQLKSLGLAGLSLLPKTSGKSTFDFSTGSDAAAQEGASEQMAQSVSTLPEAEETGPSIQAVERDETVGEARNSYQLSNTSNLAAYQTDSLGVEQRVERLAVLQERVAGCTSCKELASCRKNTVFGVGSPSPELCFLGEGPGADEDQQGEPFVGQAGQLLNKIIGACKMSREEVYILNTVKCRPPGNRNPNESELENCWPYAIEQLEILQPKFICCLGSVAARTLLQTKQSIGRMRGQFFRFRGSEVIVTYHPAYLLRNPSAKRQVWDDMKLLLAKMGREI